jgi:hypothetical protein
MIEEFAKALPEAVTGFFTFLIVIASYFVGKKSKIDDVRINKMHNFAEELSVLMQEDYRDRKFAREQYDLSFAHVSGAQEAAGCFDQFDSLYGSLRIVMQMLIERKPRIVEIKNRSAIYLPKRLMDLVDEYIELTNFEYLTDGTGLINTFAESFFEHCLDDHKASRRKEIFDEVLSQLRKAK